MKTRSQVILILGVGLLFSFGLPGKIWLRLQPEEGVSYFYQVSLVQEVRVGNPGDQKDTHNEVGIRYGVRMLSTDSHQIMLFRITYNQVRYVMSDGQNGDMGYDSAPSSMDTLLDSPTSRIFSRMLSPLIGRSFSARVTPQGKTLELIGVRSMVTQMLDSMHLDSSQLALIAPVLKRSFGKNAVNKMFANTLVPFPVQKVGVGDSWSDDLEVNSGFPMELHRTYSVRNIQENVVVLGIHTRISSDSTAV
ncbi:MAG: DUF6263 family protein, partial [Chitinophagaceae bacterium]